MKIVGIVAEFNPFHNGHKYLIEKAKELTKADLAVCIMSGSFTQAGNISIIDKFKRAKIAIQNGFDVVIELPTIYATASSEYFAYGAINILNALGCIDYICFGSETGDTKVLISIAKKLLDNNDKIWNIITDELRSGISFAAAREKAISKFLTKKEIEISNTSNNILAIQYIKTLLELKSNITPLAIKRDEGDTVISATKIRELLKTEKDISTYLPYDLSSDKLIFNDELYTLLKYRIISYGKEYLKNINEVNEGLENKIYDEINNSPTYDDFIKNIKSKRYQLSKIKRIMINILLNIKKEHFIELNTNSNIYAHVLAINPKTKKDILSLFSKSSNMPVITSLNDDLISKLNSPIRESLLLDITATNIHSVLTNDVINKDYTNKL
ncbi:MAG: nucleotidyltransferase family protein [Clostridia bacterium]|nr:nucleotidyltransferase family protein [Clostridia bacterium]